MHPMAAEFGPDLVLGAILLGGLALVIVTIVQVAKSPGLSTGAKWGWGLALGVGYWFFWLPGVTLAFVFLAMKRRWALPRAWRAGQE